MDLLRAHIPVAIALALASSLPVQAKLNLVSPGPLAAPHEKYDGPEQCTLCHEQGKQVAAAKCLDCHKELRKRIDAGRGYHGRMGAEKEACSKCHPDHAGRDLRLIQWEGGRERFDHSLAGYPLEGKHAGVRCEACHKKPGYLGLSTACADCHADIHRGEVGRKCDACHDFKGWKPASLFDHQRSRYPLTGKHLSTPCAKCHPNLKLTGIPHDTCQACHKDIHKGKFGSACETCHGTENWKKISEKGLANKGFHEKTRYPLRGAHAKVACAACHGPFPGVPARFRGLPFERCTDCHIDAHVGQISAAAGDSRTCDRCHGLEGFLPAVFTAADHERTRYPLTGAHARTECGKCHPKDPQLARKTPADIRKRISLTLFRFEGPPGACQPCHPDIHAGQFGEPRGAASPCQKCHTTEAFKEKLLFDHNDPRFTPFPLAGKHRSVECAKCHWAVPVGENVTVVKYVGLPRTCEGCHVDDHAGAFRGFEP